jgi:hypothetical protein
MGFIFYRGRSYSEATIQAMLPCLQPTAENVVAADTEELFVQGLVECHGPVI